MDDIKIVNDATDVKIANFAKHCEAMIKKIETKLENEFPIIVFETKADCEINKKGIAELNCRIDTLQ